MALLHKKQKVVYLGFCNSGGMMHYTDNLFSGCASNVDKQLVMVGTRLERVTVRARKAALFIERSSNRWVQRLLEKYNPLYYRKIAYQIVTELAPDIVHITDYSPGLLAFIRSLASKQVRVVYTMHDPEPHEETRTFWGRVYSRYQASIQMLAVMRTVDIIHVHSELHRSSIGRLYGQWAADKTYVVQHGGGLTEEISGGRAVPTELRGFLREGERALLFFGRIEEYKGVHILLQSIRSLQESGVASFKTIIAGSGDYMAKLDTSAIEGLLVINRFIEDEEIKAIFESSKLVILPYMTATQTGVIPMAYAFSTPVLSTDVGGLPELVEQGETGWLVEANKAEFLADAIVISLSNNIDLDHMGVKSLEYLNKCLSWDVVSEKHCKQYDKLLGMETSDIKKAGGVL